MRIAKIILPVTDNAGADLAAVHSVLSVNLLESFGGYTAAPVFGAWRDEESGKVYTDESTEYRIAADWNPAQRVELEDIAARYGRAAGQLSVYVEHASGAVVFVEPGEAPDAEQEARGDVAARDRARRAARLAKYATPETVAA